MRRIRIRMLASVDQLYAGTEYNLPEAMARDFAFRGKAVVAEEEFRCVDCGKPMHECKYNIGKCKGRAQRRTLPTFEANTAGPSETKPVKSAEVKKKVKRNA